MSGMAAGTGRRGGSSGAGGIVAAVVAGAAQLVVGFYTVTAVGLISVPVWAAVVLAGAWLLAAGLLVRLVRVNPWAALAVPVANALLLWVAVSAGGAWLGWTA